MVAVRICFSFSWGRSLKIQSDNSDTPTIVSNGGASRCQLIMVEGKLQIEGEVIHVVVKRCYNFSTLLLNLTPSQDENLPLLTLSHSDEKSIPRHAQNKKSQVRQGAQEKIFREARNFK